MPASKAEQIIDHFTQDAALKRQILAAIAENKGPGGSVDKILAKFHLDAGTTATVKQIIKKVVAGHNPHSITAFFTPDANRASAAAKLSQHIGVVTHIINS